MRSQPGRLGRGSDDSVRLRRHPGRFAVLNELRSTGVRPHAASGPHFAVRCPGMSSSDDPRVL
jgi:hypothetical protein